MGQDSIKSKIHKSRHLLIYGSAMAIFVFMLKWLQWKYLVADNAIEIYMGLIALVFTGLGVWMATKLIQPKVETVIIEQQVPIPIDDTTFINEYELNKLQLTRREHDVLNQIVLGHSNSEIAAHLHVSVSTVKTHASNLYAKLDVKSRAQAIEKAKRLRITR